MEATEPKKEIVVDLPVHRIFPRHKFTRTGTFLQFFRVPVYGTRSFQHHRFRGEDRDRFEREHTRILLACDVLSLGGILVTHGIPVVSRGGFRFRTSPPVSACEVRGDENTPQPERIDVLTFPRRSSTPPTQLSPLQNHEAWTQNVSMNPASRPLGKSG